MTYSTVGDYQFPNLTLPQQEKALGKYGRLRRTYLMKHRPVLYNSMLLSGTLHPHLLEVEQTAESRMQQTMQELLKQNPAPNKERHQMDLRGNGTDPGDDPVHPHALRCLPL